MLELFALALFQISSFSNPAATIYPTGTPTVMSADADHGSGGWTGIDEDHGSGGWTGIDADHGSGGWTGIDADHGSGGWTGK
ncbi:hypothetical protein [Hymenobacter sediminicola]|uniref:Uncharacterized protein n=1 Tax=Hymenobacter sediminicola TaxID=2761579 RepID=A0A7G7W9J5_9BACT|nr:hypothetical protein [Hymenobacter sediminicola]QNH63038.1 hypothetical protein H4317_04300 [Hymenobacter sediminicola]